MKTARIILENEFEADVFSMMLDDERIPHTFISHHSSAYDGLFQMTTGWGHMEFPEVYLEKAEALLQNLRESRQESVD